MPDALSEYARLAGEAFIAANREADPHQSALLRQRAYDLVDCIRARRCELNAGSDVGEQPR